MLNDSDQRRQATNPRQSFIVQAPAGSGKTEILSQRYLRLLATVNAPEQIIALTFTRKAANEMRERILRALQNTANGAQATSVHQQQTYSYAAEALARDQSLHWQLLQNPGRLRIFTIDSLCQQLTQAIPLQEKQIPYASISDKPQQHYMAAARACLDYAINHHQYHQPLKLLLKHVDNLQDKLLSLMGDLLARRDQWLLLLHDARLQEKELCEQALSSIEQHELLRFVHCVPDDCRQQLPALARQLACIEANPASARYALCDWHDFSQLDRPLADSLAALLLTSQNTLRKSFDHHVGLKKGTCDDKEYHQLKSASKDLLSKLESTPDFLDALLQVKNLPAPHYDPKQWDVLQALFTFLPLLTAHLHLVFSEHNEVDFSAISQQAIQALGDDESPTDLALYLDNQIHHLLVDEFQDTSMQQFELLSKLVHGWQPDDGRTLFVVGDPMQSIYRFRAAEVGLFLLAKQQGIGPIKLNSLELSCNFRSTATIIEWVNHQFTAIFPQTDDIESGAVSFHPSAITQAADSSSYVKAYQFANNAQEAQALVDIAQTELEAHPDDNIAILVRSRGQLIDIMRVLRSQQIPCQGIEIDLLTKLPHLRDVWSLTQLLLMPANRLAWLAFLRSPWCGLSLTDVHCIANVDKKKSIYLALAQVEKITGLSEGGQTRARFVFNVIQQALACRHQQPLVAWISDCLHQLHLQHILTSSEQDDLEQFWLLLEQFAQDGQLVDLQLFKSELNKLYSKKVTPSRLQVMTIHKSKGLEFDCVILPGLNAKPARMDTPLLRWLKLPGQHGELLLLSPMKAAEDEHCALYDYIGKLDAQKNSYEQQRLLYVAVTRAKKRLYLFDNRIKTSQGTLRYLLRNQEFIEPEELPLAEEQSTSLPALYHLPLDFYHQSAELIPSAFTGPPLAVSDPAPRLLGIVAHELLQWMCNVHPTSFDQVPWELAKNRLRSLGFTPSEHETALARLKKQLLNLFTHPVGPWLIKAHEQERNEYELLLDTPDGLATRIIDRTFCDQGIRWVIDFKTGREDEQTQASYRQQVNDYARLLSSRFVEPIHCGLYYLGSGQWVDWQYTPETVAIVE